MNETNPVEFLITADALRKFPSGTIISRYGEQTLYVWHGCLENPYYDLPNEKDPLNRMFGYAVKPGDDLPSRFYFRSAFEPFKGDERFCIHGGTITQENH